MVEYLIEDAAFRLGQSDFKCGLRRNPFKRYSNNWHLWQSGYDAAEFNERNL